MDSPTQVTVRPLDEGCLPDVVRIHRNGLGYTLNSRLGDRHLGFLYRLMAADPQSFVGVALQGQKAVGVISGTLDEDQLKARLMRSMSARGLLKFASHLILDPTLCIPWIQGLIIAMPVEHEGLKVPAVLTALAVDGSQQGRGVGRVLVEALEAYYGAHLVRVYRLDTLQTNAQALRFYRGMGFLEVTRRAGSVILTKAVAS